ncbi:Ceramide glucosyltransferase [Minicystis rosea]|nr:Ceramide glucosyltransferase [Minicystis rosea]
MLDNLTSFAHLEGARYELLLGIACPDDPAIPVIRTFLAAHPALSARLVVTTPPCGEIQNPKVAQLISLSRAARGSVIVVSDANVRVSPSHLRSLLAALSQPGIGLVSSVVVGGGERTLAAAIDSAQLGAYIAPSVVAAHTLRLWPITVGKTMAMRSRDLTSIGGFESVGAVLAEDDVLGQRFVARGLGVALCLEPVENYSPTACWSSVLKRHVRWAAMRRSLTMLGFAFELFLSPLLVATVTAVIALSRLSLGLLIAATIFSCGGAYLSLSRTRRQNAAALAALEPVRVAVMFSCWLAGWFIRTVTWRGNAFRIASGTRLTSILATPVASTARASVSPHG